VNKIASLNPTRVGATAAARELIGRLKKSHGPIMFHLSGGCCDGSAPMCFQVGEFKLGDVDEKVGEIAGCEFWMDREQLRRWVHTRWMVDVVPGRGASFSLEAPLNLRFMIRSSLCGTVADIVTPEASPGDEPLNIDTDTVAP
jgi:uncharacterized protein (DUF779 family)